MTEDFNKITADWCKEHGVTFRKLVYNHDFVHQDKDHRRGSNFFTYTVISIDEESFPNLPRYADGLWQTNCYITDTEYGDNWEEINELIRVKAKEIITTTIEYVPV